MYYYEFGIGEFTVRIYSLLWNLQVSHLVHMPSTEKRLCRVVRALGCGAEGRLEKVAGSSLGAKTGKLSLSTKQRLKAAKGKDWVPPYTCRATGTMGL